MKTVTVVYEIVDELEWAKRNPLHYVHDGLQAVRVGIGDAIDARNAVYERFVHLDRVLRDCATADDTIYRTAAELWEAIAAPANAGGDRKAVSDAVDPDRQLQAAASEYLRVTRTRGNGEPSHYLTPANRSVDEIKAAEHRLRSLLPNADLSGCEAVRSKSLLADRESLLDWAETLLCNAVPMSHCTQADWDARVTKWRDEKHGVPSTANSPICGKGQNGGGE